MVRPRTAITIAIVLAFALAVAMSGAFTKVYMSKKLLQHRQTIRELEADKQMLEIQLKSANGPLETCKDFLAEGEVIVMEVSLSLMECLDARALCNETLRACIGQGEGITHIKY